MKKINGIMAEAFLLGKPLRRGNYETDGKSLWVFGIEVARKIPMGIEINDRGYVTDTTCRTLSAVGILFGWKVYRRKGEMFFDFHRSGTKVRMPSDQWINPEDYRGLP